MKLTSHDWQVLQLPLIALVVVVVIVLLLVGYTGNQKDQAWQNLQAQQSQLNQARSRFETSGAEKDMIAHYMPQYLQLVHQGFIGEERRIEWIDDLRTINQQYKLFGISYTIGAQETHKPVFNLVPGPFTLHRSVMKVATPLLHEGDLMTVVNAMASRQRAPFLLRDCEITRIPGGSHNKFLPNLDARCEIDWLTVTEPERAGAPK